MRVLFALTVALLVACLASVFLLEQRVSAVATIVQTLEASMTVQEGELYHAHWTIANGVKRLVEVRTKRADYPDAASWHAAHLAAVANAIEQHPPV